LYVVVSIVFVTCFPVTAGIPRHLRKGRVDWIP